MARPCPLPPRTSSLLSAWLGCGDRRPLGEASRRGEGTCCCARNMRAELVLNGSTRHRSGHGYGCPFSQRLFRPPLCLWRIPLSPGKPRPPARPPCATITWTCMGGTYQIRLSLPDLDNDSIESTPSLRVNPPVSTPPSPPPPPRQASSGAGHIPGAGARRRSQRVGSYCNRRLALVPWPIADASYI